MLKLLNFSCSRCSFPSDHSDHFLVNINSLPADGSLRGVGNCILGYAEDTLPEAKPRRDNVVYVR